MGPFSRYSVATLAILAGLFVSMAGTLPLVSVATAPPVVHAACSTASGEVVAGFAVDGNEVQQCSDALNWGEGSSPGTEPGVINATRNSDGTCTNSSATSATAVLMCDSVKTDPTTFGGGEKESAPCNWTVISSSINVKTDVANGFVTGQTDSTTGDRYIIAGTDVVGETNNPSHDYDIEFNRQVSSTGVPVREPGDILVTLDYNSNLNGGTMTYNVFVAQAQYANTTNCPGEAADYNYGSPDFTASSTTAPALYNGVLIGAWNTAQINCGTWDCYDSKYNFQTSLPTLNYFETALDLTQVFNTVNQTANPKLSCDLEYVSVRSRESGSSPSSTISDMLAPQGFNVCGTSSTSTLTSPQDQTVCPGSTASFTASEVGSPTPTAQWQQSTDGGTTWTNITGATSDTYSFNATSGQNGYQYRAVFTGSSAIVTTSPATLTVGGTPSINADPLSQTGTTSQTVSFTSGASGTSTPTLAWQVSTDSGATWQPAGSDGNPTTGTAASSSPLAFTPTASQNDYQYEAVWSNSCGNATSKAATLTVNFAPTVSTSPQSLEVCSGQTASFTSTASGNPAPAVAWHVEPSGGSTWQSSGADGNTTSGTAASTTTLSFTAAASQSGNQYQAVFTNSVSSVTSTPATLTVDTAPSGVTDPGSQTVPAGQSVTFTSSAGGSPAPTVVWQVSTNSGSTWQSAGSDGNPTAGSAVSTPSLSFTATSSQSGYEYRVSWSNTCGSATANPATLGIHGTITAAYVRSATLQRTGGRLVIRWRLAEHRGVLGFDLYARARRLNHHLIHVHESDRYTFNAPWHGYRAVMLHVVMIDGRHVSIHVR